MPETDKLYEEARALTEPHGRGSCGYLQRYLKVGYNQAAKLVERMEEEGFITSPDMRGIRTLAKIGRELCYYEMKVLRDQAGEVQRRVVDI